MNVKTIICGLLATTAFGAGAATVAASGAAESKVEQAEASVTNGKYRINVLTNSANWIQDNNITLFNPAGSNVGMSRDTDFTVSSSNSNYSSVKIGNTTYNWETYEFSSRDNFTSSGDSWFGRGTSTNLDGYNWFNSGINIQNQFKNNYWDNTFIISGSWDNFSASGYGWYVKVCLHTGLDLGSTSYIFMNCSGVPDTPSSINGKEFEGWYTDSNLTNRWISGSQYTDINLYAKYRESGYYLVGDSNFVSELGTGSSTWSIDSGVLMNNVDEGGNKASYTFTTTKTITFKARYWSSSSDYYVTHTYKSESATGAGVTFDKDGNYVVPAGTYSLYIYVENHEDASSLTYGMPLDSYCTEFLTQTGAKCKGDSTNKSELAAVWSSMQTDWGKLNSDDQSTLVNASASESGTDEQKVMARYDHIIKKYSDFNDFMGRKSNPNYTYKTASLNPIAKSNDISVVAVVIISISLIATGAFFLLRKKRLAK